jgi:chromosome partitioning protein
VSLSAAGNKVHREVAKFVDDYGCILVDCPPAVESPAPQSALLTADVALVPVTPSPLDLWAAVGIRTIIEQIRAINAGLQARLVINSLEPRTALAREIKAILDEFGIPLLTSALHHRTVYRQSAVFGGTVHQFRRQGARAIEEVEGLTDEVVALLGGESVRWLNKT